MKVLLATDGTKYGKAATTAVKLYNLGDGDEILIVSVVDVAIPMAIDIYGGYLPDTTDLEKAGRESAAKVLETAKSDLGEHFGKKHVAVSTDILFGSPDSRIVETAEETGADLIVIGSHGYKRWERLLLGSVSDSVVHHAHCSVMVVRTDATGD